MSIERITLAAAIVKFLKAQYVVRDGIEHRLIHGVFGIFGHGNVTGLGQALEEFGGTELPYLQPKNEQAMVHTAIGFSKARKRLGTYACTTSIGPGATNLVTGAATATLNRIPVLLLPGDIFANRIPSPVLQQLEYAHSMDVSVNDCLKPVSKYWDRLNRPEQVLKALPEAMRILADPAETGAVTLCLPQDVQTEVFDCPSSFFEKRVYRLSRSLPAEEDLAEATHWIRRSEKPLIIAGGGVHYSDATEVLKTFAEETGIPVCVTQAGKGSLLETHPLALGGVGVTGTRAANRIAEEADLIFCLGTRLSDFTTASQTQFQNSRVRFLNLNTNASDSFKNQGLPLVGDIARTLTKLGEELKDYQTPAEYRGLIEKIKLGWECEYQQITSPSPQGSSLGQAEVIHIINETLDNRSTIVHAAGSLPGDLHKLWKCNSHFQYHSEYAYSCMGYEIAGALGVKMALPEREVYALVGDGSYLMLNHEIVTSLQEGYKINLILFDNHGYQCIHNLQRNCGGKGFGNEFRYRTDHGRLEGEPLLVDYVENAKSLGAVTFRANSLEEVAQALNAAKQETVTTLIYIPIDPKKGVPGFSWWDVPIAEDSGIESVQEARDSYENAKFRQRLEYMNFTRKET